MATAINNEAITVLRQRGAEKIKSVNMYLGIDDEDVDETHSAPIDSHISREENTPEAQDAPAGSNAVDGENTTGVMDAPTTTDTTDVKIATEAQDAPEKGPKEKKPGRKKKETKNETKTETKGISSKSPVVRLLDEEKTLIKRLEAHILLETGETVTDHQLVMDAVREYSKKHYPHFR